ncbi:MAG TPA: ATP-dependent metallopeptidase FtsH/Yme1/Tma family protein, partial [Anaerolineales bacterium]|nr:ATP-dependent metallopeptidase FtsH/Yme1/Tma family protein [Anaerolineales bacterium]
MNSNRAQSFIIYALLFVAIIAIIVFGLKQGDTGQQPLTINEVAQAIQSGSVARITTDNDDNLHIIYKSGKEADSHKESGATLVDQLLSLGVTPQQLSSENVKIEVKPPSIWSGALGSLLVYVLPLVLMVGVLWFIFR